jgi:DNA-binding CsgD family transcriptional regulator
MSRRGLDSRQIAEVLALVQNVDVGSPEYVASRPAFVGRERELAAIDAFVADSATTGGARLLTGPAGIGKTRLLVEADRIATSFGSRVLAVSCVEFETELSYAGLNRLLAPLRTELHRFLDPGRMQALNVALGYADGPPPTALLVYGAALELLDSASRRQPIIVIVDDLPWLDAASATALAFIVQRISDTRVGFLGAARDAAKVGFRSTALTELKVPALTDQHAELLVEQGLPQLPRASRRRVLAQAQGNPLAILELGCVAEQYPRRTDYCVDVIPLSDRLKQSFSFRISDLPEETRRVLLLLALHGREDLAAMQELGIDLSALRPAEEACLIVIDDSRMSLRFAHPLMKAAVVDESSFADRRSAHLAIAESLVDEPHRQAWHLANAAVDVDENTAELLEQSANEALRRGDVYGCVQALDRAARLSPDLADRRRRLALVAYLEAEVIGEPAHASERLEYLRDLPGCAVESLHAAVATALVYADTGGDCSSAHHLIETAINSGFHGWKADDVELVEAFYAWFIICWQAGTPSLWDSYFDAVSQLKPGCPLELSLLNRAFGDPVRFGGGVRDELRTLLAVAHDGNDPMRTVRLNTAAVYVDLLASGRTMTWRLIEDGRQGRSLRTYLRALMLQCLDDFGSGHWLRAKELADEGLAASKDTAQTSSWYFLYAHALLDAVRGDVTASNTWATELDRATFSREAFGIQRLSHHARTLAAQARGDWEDAYRHAIILSRPGQFDCYAPEALWVAYDVVECALRTGRTAEALAHVRALQDLDIAALSPRLALLARGATALIDDSTAGVTTFQGALGSADAAAWPFDYARVQLAYGHRLRRELRLKDARTELHQALATFEAIGARPWAERTRAELRASRDKIDGAGETSVLTPQEWTIAEQAAAGLSNKAIAARLFLSPRTVGGHLYRIYPKLGIGSRAGLRDAISALRESDEGLLECESLVERADTDTGRQFNRTSARHV